MKKFSFIMLVFLCFSISSCKKDNTIRCERLKEAVFANSVQSIKTIITGYIRQLPSKRYNRLNIEYLTSSISNCDISCSLLCFDCITTLPSQTEISLHFSYNGIQCYKVIDLSYSTDNNIIFRNMHD